MDDFFSFVSKAVIVIPIVIFILSLFFKFNTTKTGLMNQVPTIITSTPIVQNNTFKFDLKGPIVCDNLFIENKKVLLKNKSTNYLLSGDCLYFWQEGKLVGGKKCSLSNYINMAENYLGFLNIDDLANNSLIKDKMRSADIDFAKVVKSCKREEIKDKSIFEVPKQVRFEIK